MVILHDTKVTGHFWAERITYSDIKLRDSKLILPDDLATLGQLPETFNADLNTVLDNKKAVVKINS